MHDTAPRLVETADGRVVGYRRFGSGPAVALLHASPRSAAALLPLGRLLADRFTVFAFDTPGFGWSEKLPMARPDATDFGDALIAAFDALGLGQVPVYGSHTGAAIAVAAAVRHPQRVTALALDGYAIFTPTEQAEYLATYLAPIRPEWDGTHLAFLWSRVKDQFTFFPWYLRGQYARLRRPLPPLSVLQNVIVDFLAAGDDYRPGYAAAFRIAGDAMLRRVVVPTTVMARVDDLLFGHLDLLQNLPATITIDRLPADDTAWAAGVAAALRRGVARDAPAIPPLRTQPRRQGPWTEIVRLPEGSVGVTCFGGTATGKPLVLLPGIPGSVRGEAALARSLADHRPVFGIDLPGFGATSFADQPDSPAIATRLGTALRLLGIIDFDIVACSESAGIGLAMGPAVVLDPVAHDARAALLERMAEVTPRSDGTHLLAAWHQLRDMQLWRPWVVPTPQNAIDFGTDPNVESLMSC